MVSRKKILHLIPNEKITSQIVDNFNLINVENIFIFFTNDSYSINDSVDLFSIKNLKLNEIINEKKIEGLIIHGLYPQFAKLICGLKSDIKIAWFVWGFDIYNRPKVRRTLYAAETKSIVLNSMSIAERFKSYPFLRKLFCLITKKEDFEIYIESSYKRITYFCTYIFEDFKFFDTHFNHRTSFFDTPFCSIEQYLAGNKELRINDNARDIIIGNSNSSENNHLDVFLNLKKISLELPNIYVPLSYGNDLVYRGVVLKKGKEIIREHFQPLLDFMDRGKYFEILRGCSVAIFYHYRQQAMGNIIALLYMGVRVYLSQKNPIYQFFLRHDISVYDFDSEFKKFSNQKMYSEDAENNRRILSELFSEERIKKSLTALTNEL
ncbi:4-alpha-L-fucosyltransferase (glycosyl transferase family 56) [Sphingobacterium detergens]|uniref:4-alpha-L-fucosyltransferase (Glycosyl transferase family 56) n=1 Tax=Sphingobacterium detergens TaxID=1145106 RepID=A0A420ALQ6_SPHD1|nr:4-alpha-L-fucosyltransferase (glycosyl transferase family 56) [Sphingobacterium detergens]